FAVFGSFACLAWAAMNFLANKTSRATERLEELRNPLLRSKERASDKQNMLEKAAPTLSKALQPKTELEQSNLKLRLANAGFSTPHASEVYLTIKFVSLLTCCMLGSSFGFIKWG